MKSPERPAALVFQPGLLFPRPLYHGEPATRTIVMKLALERVAALVFQSGLQFPCLLRHPHGKPEEIKLVHGTVTGTKSGACVPASELCSLVSFVLLTSNLEQK